MATLINGPIHCFFVESADILLVGVRGASQVGTSVIVSVKGHIINGSIYFRIVEAHFL